MPGLIDERRVQNREEHIATTGALPNPNRNTIPDAVYDKIFRSPSIFGRIVLVAAMRHPLPGEVGFPAPYLALTCEQAFRDLHLDVFSAWLLHPLRRQMADINIYMNRSGFSDVRQLVTLGERSLPPEADHNDRELFLHDLKIIEVLLANRVE